MCECVCAWVCMHILVGSTVGRETFTFCYVQCVYTLSVHTLHLHWLPQWNIIYVVKRKSLRSVQKKPRRTLPENKSKNKRTTTNIFSINFPFFFFWIWFRNIHWLLTVTTAFDSVQSVTSRLFICTVRCVCRVCVLVSIGGVVWFSFFFLFIFHIVHWGT